MGLLERTTLKRENKNSYSCWYSENKATTTKERQIEDEHLINKESTIEFYYRDENTEENTPEKVSGISIVNEKKCMN